MKKIFSILVFLAMAVSAYAQYATPALAERVGCRIKIGDDKLSVYDSDHLMTDVNGVDYTEQWEKARRGRTAGIVMIPTGGVIAAGGVFTLMFGGLTSALGAVTGATTGAIVGSIGGEETAQQTASNSAQQGAKAGQPFITAGIIVGAIGLGIHFTGVALTIINSTKMSRMVDKYNESLTPFEPETESAPEMELSFGPTLNGVGLRLSF